MIKKEPVSQPTIKDRLRHLGLKRSRNIFVNPWKSATILLALGSLTMLLAWLFDIRDYTQLASIVLAVGAFLVGLQQWKLSRIELAFDKFYERLDIVNNRLDQWPAARDLVQQFWGKDCTNDEYQKRMYVFVEIDNLEYATQKYEMLFMGAEDTYREITLFQSRCVSEEFRVYAERLVDIAGYRQNTRNIVHKIIGEIKHSQKT